MGRILGCILFLLLGLTGSHANAVLGGSVDSMALDQLSLHATGKIQKRSLPQYSIHEVESDSVKIKEYVSQDGTIFAITWSGNRHPDLEPLLGAYESDYSAANAITPKLIGARRRTLRSSRLVVHTFGHMRHLQGRIYDPNLVPKGVSIDELL